MKISVIIPVYNSEAYLNDLLYSLTLQTLKDLEIILIDDASTDQSLSILKSWQQKFPNRIHVYQNQVNLGQGTSRNIGLKYAQGEYISFVDSDDYIHPNMYDEMYQGALDHGMPDIITTGIVFAKESSTFQDYYPSFRRTGIIYSTQKESDKIIAQSPSCGNKLFKREFLAHSSFLVNTMWEDVAFSYSHLFLTDQVLAFDNHDYYYRKHSSTGVSSKGFRINPKIMDIFKVADEIEEKTKKNSRYLLFEKEIKLLQVISCLHRIREVLDWNIDPTIKKELCLNLYHLVQLKYASIHEVNQDLLAMNVDFLTIEEVSSYPSRQASIQETKENIDQLILSLKKE